MADMTERRARIREFVQTDLQDVAEGDDPGLAEGFLTRWLLVCELETPSGDRWLTKASGDASDRSLTSWQQRGLAGEVVHDFWDDSSGSDENEEDD